MQTPFSRHFTVLGRLTLGHGITLRGGSSNMGGVHIGANGLLTMREGSVIENCHNSSMGGAAVNVGNPGARFDMQGGIIRNNVSSGGGGVHLLFPHTSMTMSGGVIEGNTATGSGGGVRVSAFDTATFTMTGGIIHNNSAHHGGGVYVASVAAFGTGSFTMTGGSITDNEATGDGGGIHTGRASDLANVPPTAYDNLYIGGAAVFSGNRAGRVSLPPYNVGVLSNLRFAQASIHGHILNNYDINYTGRVLVSAIPIIHTWDQLRTAINQAPANELTVIQVAANLTTTGARNPNAIEIPEDRIIVLESDDASTSRNVDMLTRSQRHFTVYGQLTLGNRITLRGGTLPWNSNNAGGVQVYAGGTLAMLDNSVIQWANRTGWNLADAGGAVNLAGSGAAEETRATFVMDGGVIQNNRAYRGGGVFVGAYADALLHSGVIGGSINMALGNTASYGGGISIDGGTFTMTGGAIEGNAAWSSGGGIFQYSGTVTIEAGEISYNTAQTGGGVRVETTEVNAFTMTSGAMRNNSAGGDGGAIFAGAYSLMEETLPEGSLPMLHIYDGVIFAGNTAGAGWFMPPWNATTATQIRTTSSSVDEVDHPLNNYDINFWGFPIAFVHSWDGLREAVNDRSVYEIRIAAPHIITTGAVNPDAIVIPQGRHVRLASAHRWTNININMLTYGQRHFEVYGELILDSGITLRGGETAENTNNAGGVQVNAGGTLMMRYNSTIQYVNRTGATMADFGGAVNLLGSFDMGNATFLMEDSVIKHNSAVRGGGIFVGEHAHLSMHGGSIYGNTASDTAIAGGGGGIFQAGGSVHIFGGSISNNAAPNGGGVRVATTAENAFTMTSGSMINNRATAGDGGAIFAGAYTLTADPLPANSLPMLYIRGDRFLGPFFWGNTASTGHVTPPANAATASRIQITSSSVGGTNHPLNNYDINFRESAPPITTWDGLREAVYSAPVNELYTIEIAGSLTTTGAVNPNAIEILADRNIVLESTNYTVDMLTYGQRHFTVNGRLTLGAGITLRGGETEENTNNAGGIEVNAGGTLTMLDGSVIQWVNRTGVTIRDFGGAVNLLGSGLAPNTRARLIMEGGVIHENSAVRGGGIFVGDNAHFAMLGGMICCNTASDREITGGGGGIFQALRGTVHIATGEIINNHAPNGGGVRVVATAENAFTMTGGAMRGNRATEGDGGAILADASAVPAGPIPPNSAPMLHIHAGVIFEGNSAYAGWFVPPPNAVATRILTSSSSLDWLGIWHPLNNYDVNIRRVVVVNTLLELRNAISSAQTNEVRRIHISNDLLIIGMPIVIPPGRNIILESSVATEIRNLDMQTNGQRHFMVNGQLTLGSGITLRGGTTATNTNNAGGVQVNPGGTLTMLENSAIQWVNRLGTTELNFGGAVHLSGGTGIAIGTRATFIMEGGTIQNNSADRGGGVFARMNAHFVMHGGEISGNRGTGTMPISGGGGVFMDGGTFTMTGGTIADNTAFRGGGVRLQSGTFMMDGTTARIERNTATGPMLAGGGGGIFITGNGTVHIAAGEINNNTASNGGGVRIEGTTPNAFTMTGGAMTSNSATAGVGGAISAIVFNMPQAQLLLPVNFSRIPDIHDSVIFSGNTASAGWIAPQINQAIAARIQATSSSVNGVNHPLNNWDINFNGQGTDGKKDAFIYVCDVSQT